MKIGTNQFRYSLRVDAGTIKAKTPTDAAQKVLDLNMRNGNITYACGSGSAQPWAFYSPIGTIKIWEAV